MFNPKSIARAAIARAFLPSYLALFVSLTGPALAADRGGSHDHGGHDHGGHDQGNHDQGNHDQGNHDQGNHDQGNHDQGNHDQGNHDQGNHDQGNHDQGNHDGGPGGGKGLGGSSGNTGGAHNAVGPSGASRGGSLSASRNASIADSAGLSQVPRAYLGIAVGPPRIFDLRRGLLNGSNERRELDSRIPPCSVSCQIWLNHQRGSPIGAWREPVRRSASEGWIRPKARQATILKQGGHATAHAKNRSATVQVVSKTPVPQQVSPPKQDSSLAKLGPEASELAPPLSRQLPAERGQTSPLPNIPPVLSTTDAETRPSRESQTERVASIPEADRATSTSVSLPKETAELPASKDSIASAESPQAGASAMSVVSTDSPSAAVSPHQGESQFAARKPDEGSQEGHSAETALNFDVGDTVPAQIRLLPIPKPILEVFPELREYKYAVLGEIVAIIDPLTMKVVGKNPPGLKALSR